MMLPTKHAAHKWVSLHPGMDLTRASVLFTNTIKKAKKVNITPLFKLKNMLLRYDCAPTDFQGFDSEEVAMSICLDIPKFNGDEYRVIKRTTISIDEQCAHFVY